MGKNELMSPKKFQNHFELKNFGLKIFSQNNFMLCQKKCQQAGSELCQAQTRLSYLIICEEGRGVGQFIVIINSLWVASLADLSLAELSPCHECRDPPKHLNFFPAKYYVTLV